MGGQCMMAAISGAREGAGLPISCHVRVRVMDCLMMVMIMIIDCLMMVMVIITDCLMMIMAIMIIVFISCYQTIFSAQYEGWSSHLLSC